MWQHLSPSPTGFSHQQSFSGLSPHSLLCLATNWTMSWDVFWIGRSQLHSESQFYSVLQQSFTNEAAQSCWTVHWLCPKQNLFFLPTPEITYSHLWANLYLTGWSYAAVVSKRFYFCKKRRNLWNCKGFCKYWFWRMAMMSPIWEVGGDPLKIYSFQPSVRSPLTFHQRTIKKTVICCPSVKTAGWRSLVLTLFSQQFLKLGEDDVKLRNCTSCPMPPSRSTFFFF